MDGISAERCIGGRELTEPRLSPDGSCLVYAAASAESAALMLSLLDGGVPRQLTSYPPPRPGRGLGGGCWCWTPDSSAVVYCGADGNLWMQAVPGGEVRRLTDHGPDRIAQGPSMTADGEAVLFVIDQAEVWLQPLAGGEPRRIDQGNADFCFDPVALPGDGGVMWQAWSVPDMAWDAAYLQRSVGEPIAASAAQQPQVFADGTLAYVCDSSGWNNVWVDGEPLVVEPFEHAGPTWGFGQRSYAASPDASSVAVARNAFGFGQLCVVDRASRVVSTVARGVHGQLSWQGNRLAAVRTGAKTPTQIVVYDTDSWERITIDVGPLSGWETEPLVEPELVEVTARDGATVYPRLYRATPYSDRLLCWMHGGPTDQWQVTFMPRIAFWRSRGWNVLLPDHRGSTGHGRQYQQSMNGRWGDLDVTDIADVVAHAHRSNWGHPSRTALMGGSAGGFTVLGVLRQAPDIAAAAVVSYPVTDLLDLAERSHRFERHYTHTLVAPLPPNDGDHEVYTQRSPVTFAADLRTPLLILHGDADPVVPVEQSRMLATRIVEGGGIVELCIYEGEGHGFRQPLNQLDEYRRIERFLAEHIDSQTSHRDQTARVAP